MEDVSKLVISFFLPYSWKREIIIDDDFDYFALVYVENSFSSLAM